MAIGIINRALGGNQVPLLITRGLAAGPEHAPSEGVPTDVRVETYSAGTSVIRWSYDGSNPVEIFRSIDGGVSYVNISGGGVLAGTTRFLDSTQGDGIGYFYKVTDDGGVTFSSPVFVMSVTNCVTVSNTPGLIERAVNEVTPEMFNQVVEHLQHQDDQDSLNPPCIICSKDGAVVINCLDNCNHFQISVVEDINSISLIGCDGCPDVNFFVADGETFGVCGFPPECTFSGDECVDAPITGPKKFNTTSGVSGPIPPTGGSSGPCPCVPPVTIVPEIQCCTAAPCEFNCDESKTLSLKACGGYGKPYTWSVLVGSNHVTLSPNKSNSAMCSVKYLAAAPVNDSLFCETIHVGVTSKDSSHYHYAMGKSHLCGGYTDPLMHSCGYSIYTGPYPCSSCIGVALGPICGGRLAPLCDFTDPAETVVSLIVFANINFGPYMEMGTFSAWGSGDPVPAYPGYFAADVGGVVDCTCSRGPCGSAGCPDSGGIQIQVVDALGTIATTIIDVNP